MTLMARKFQIHPINLRLHTRDLFQDASKSKRVKEKNKDKETYLDIFPKQFLSIVETSEVLRCKEKRSDINPFTPKSDQLQFSLSVSHQRYIMYSVENLAIDSMLR